MPCAPGATPRRPRLTTVTLALPGFDACVSVRASLKPRTPVMDRAAAHELSPVRKDLTTLLKLSGPVVLSRLGIMTMGLTDAVVVGRFSATQLGYHALGWAPTSVVLTMVVGLLTGVQVMTARAIGEGRRDKAGAVLRRGLAYAFWIGLVSTVVLAIVGPPFLHSIRLEPGLADGASRALLVFSLSLTGYA